MPPFLLSGLVRRVLLTRCFLPLVQPCSPRRTNCPARPLSSTGVAPLPWYYGPIRHPEAFVVARHNGFASTTHRAVRDLGASLVPAFTRLLACPRSLTPAESPAQSP